MAKQKEDPASELFANIRLIMIFVVFGTTIVAFVEYHSQASVKKTHTRWSQAIETRLENDSKLSVAELDRMIYGFPHISDSKVGMPAETETDEEDDSEVKEGESEEEKKTEEEIAKPAAGGKVLNYAWEGMFSKSFVSVSISNDEEPIVYRISGIQH